MGEMSDFMVLGAAMTTLTGCPDDAVTEVGDGHWVALSGAAQFPDYNMVGFTAEVSDATFDETLDVLERRDLDAIVMVEVGADRLLERASDAGLAAAGEAPIMARGTDGLDGLPSPPAGARVRLAGRQEMDTGAKLVADAFGFDADAVRKLSPPSLADGADVWFVETGDEVVAAGTCIRIDSTVNVFAMSTPERHRRKGYGAAVLAEAMRHYAADGVTRVVLGATELGFPLYEHLGFTVSTNAAVYVRGVSAQFH